MVINKVRIEDGGEYKCVARNEAGTSQKVYILEVREPPHFTEDKTHYLTIEGQNLVLECRVRGTPRPSITWRKGGQLLPWPLHQKKSSKSVDIDSINDPSAAALTRYMVQNDGQDLYLEDLDDESRTGVYSCVAENIAGRISKDFYVSVIFEPKVRERQQSVEVFENDHTTLHCPVQIEMAQNTGEFSRFAGNESVVIRGKENSAADLLKIEWWHNDEEIVIAHSATHRISVSGLELDLWRMNAKASGRYECVAKNEAGEAKSTFHVVVFMPPKLVRPSFRALELMANQTMRLECSLELPKASSVDSPHAATTFGPVQLEWLKNGVPLEARSSNDRRIQALDNGTVLSVEHVRIGDEGRYTCAAKNRAGEDLMDFVVMVTFFRNKCKIFIIVVTVKIQHFFVKIQHFLFA